MSREADRVRRAADELRSDMGLLLLPDGTYTSSGRCAEEALRHHGASVSKATRSFGTRPSEVWRASGGDPTKLVNLLTKHADELDREGVTPQKPTEQPKPKKVREPRTTGRQRTGAAPWKLLGVALVAVFLLGVVVRVVQAVAAAVTEAARAVGEAVQAVNAVATDVAPFIAVVSALTLLGVHIDWRHVHAWHSRRRERDVALEARRAEWQALVDADAEPIALGPVAEVKPQLEPAVDPLVRAWTDPGRAVPDYVHLYRARTGKDARR